MSVTRTRRIAAPPAQVWETIADHESWSEWFPPVSRVERIDSADAVGGHRRVHIGRVVVEEEFLAWEPDARFAFTLTGCTLPGVVSMVEDVSLAPVGDAATEVRYTQAVQTVGARWSAPLLRRALPGAIDRGLAGLARRIEN